jgi:hypothetical protein
MDWRASGRLLRDRLADRQADFEEKINVVASNLSGHLASDAGFFAWAARAHARGERSDLLIDYLRSDRPFGREQRVRLADEIDGKYPKVVRDGRPADEDLHLVVLEARMFYMDWKKENRERRISDHGHSGDMKKFAVKAVIELCGYEGVSVEKALDLWARPSQRHK